MSRRTFDDDLGIVGEITTYGDLMPVMGGRRSDYARLKQLKNSGLLARLEAVNRIYSEVYKDWVAIYGTPTEKRQAIHNNPAAE